MFDEMTQETSISHTTSIHDFFSRRCPAKLEQKRELCRQLGGTYGFFLKGQEGGSWTVDFASAQVTEGLCDDLTLYIEMDVCDFKSLLAGSLRTSIPPERVLFAGRRRSLRNLSLLSRAFAY